MARDDGPGAWLPHEAAAELAGRLQVVPGHQVRHLGDEAAAATHGVRDRAHGEQLLAGGIAALAELQARLAADGSRGVLLVLQGLDAAGKDSTIKHVMSGLNPQGVEVRSFKQPSAGELAHDWLWRYQQALPARGRIAIFNRSHYEEVLVVRVHPEALAREQAGSGSPQADSDQGGAGHEIWRRRYRAINDWERHLGESGVAVVKVMLHVSRRQQARRFLDRIDEPEKNWKFSASDVAEHDRFDEYRAAFSEMLEATSTAHAPWHVVPADHKWYARLATAAVLVDALARLDPRYPSPDEESRRQMEATRPALLAELAELGGEAALP